MKCNVTKLFEFESSHRLENYDGPCARWHGHSYKLAVTIQGPINEETGMVADFGRLKQLVNENVVYPCDHRNLNQTMPFVFSMMGRTTAENMITAFWCALDHEISEKLEGCCLMELSLHETRDNCVSLTREMVYSD